MNAIMIDSFFLLLALLLYGVTVMETQIELYRSDFHPQKNPEVKVYIAIDAEDQHAPRA